MAVTAKDWIIKQVEGFRGIYRYPNRMLGRRLNRTDLPDKTDILVIAAHPDDDVLGIGIGLHRHSLSGKRITVTFTTNGTGESWKAETPVSNRIAETRLREAAEALSLIGIPSRQILCLGFPDRGTHRYLKEMADDLSFLMDILQPERIYVHSIEGGHIDHDLTSYVTQSLCAMKQYSSVYEWAEYNKMYSLGSSHIDFPPHPSAALGQKEALFLTEQEHLLKKQMLACHKSQILPEYTAKAEVFRQAMCSDLDAQLFHHCKMNKNRLYAAITDFNKSRTGRGNHGMHEVEY
ncbi:PIG-L family deacetylase [Paenibacillus sp. P26]|nr:PIG-L family deacetylase [Paenibacillus sp. P26]UUZ90160.1 PIG-L family deacetylase [Paenibacillus sp. P25]